MLYVLCYTTVHQPHLLSRFACQAFYKLDKVSNGEIHNYTNYYVPLTSLILEEIQFNEVFGMQFL